MDQPLWQPSPERIARAHMTAFMRMAEDRWDVRLDDYWALQAWSTDAMDKFWVSVWDYCGVIGDRGDGPAVVDGDKMPGAKFFPEARINFAENLLRRRDDGDALVFRGEDRVRRRLSHRVLYDLVSRTAQALADLGVGSGDRVGGFMPNMPETIVAMLAAASLGAVWSSCSPDFGVKGVMDRFGQIAPKVLFTADGYFYNGKSHDSLERAKGIADQLGAGLVKVVVVPYTREAPSLDAFAGRAVMLADLIAPYAAGDIAFRRMPFGAPLYIMYSSGTTGVPKCIVHGIGGTLLKHLTEQRLHGDVHAGDRLFYFTTCGWMMWNWLASGLASEATLLLYDGSPFYPDGNVLFDYAEDEAMTHFGTSAKFIDAAMNAGLDPANTHKLDSLRTVFSTGSPLAPQGFDYVYQHVKTDVCLASIAGGTDIIGCFVGGVPILPVWRGEIQAAALGMDTQVFGDDGKRLVGEKGELVCVRPFPSMPIGFWDDADGTRYHDAYFDVFPNVWCHGDYVEETKHHGFIIYGRSDAVLNPGGVRIGTAEIYRQVEKLDEVEESIVIGQDWDNDVRVVLFVRLKPGMQLDDDLRARIRQQIRANTTPRHVPAKIVPVADIPRTLSGKIVELAVRNVVHGRPVKNKDALANPEALDLYENLPELREK